MATGTQIEFIVDNKAVSELANGTVGVSNPKHAASVTNIRQRLLKLYGCYDYKASFLDPVDWRAREWNRGADHLAGYALKTKSTGCNLDEHRVRACLPREYIWGVSGNPLIRNLFCFGGRL